MKSRKTLFGVYNGSKLWSGVSSALSIHILYNMTEDFDMYCARLADSYLTVDADLPFNSALCFKCEFHLTASSQTHKSRSSLPSLNDVSKVAEQSVPTLRIETAFQINVASPHYIKINIVHALGIIG